MALGTTLQRAGLITEAQLQVALCDQSYEDGLLGEILVARKWIKKQTVEFFIDCWPYVCQRPGSYNLGECLLQASLINSDQLHQALELQQYNGSRLGEILVAQGWVKQQTVDFLLETLVSSQQS
ncbi:MAG: hypothetical protein HC921_17955 [Synechococcaceae cyanobacterium SM2_3_1]|nr:hypothetical protein [Synechococcaceae cyanobacterium SM2_3_1]